MRPHHHHNHHHQFDGGTSFCPSRGGGTYCSVSATNICENFPKKKSIKYCKLLSAKAVAEERIKGSGNWNCMLQHYSRFLTPSSLFSLPAFLLIYFCRLCSLASHVQYIRNKICSHISNAEHLSLGEERGGGYFFNKKRQYSRYKDVSAVYCRAK